MFIRELKLSKFRNYSDATFYFSKGINVLTGKNAQGKTNCAEAIFYLCTGYSPRAKRDSQVISYGEKSSKISGIAQTDYGSCTVSIEFTQGKKNIEVNSVPIKKIGELMGNINSVYFNPGDLKLIKESPDDRRRFLNLSLSQTNRQYFYALQNYVKVLEQRNALLKNPSKDEILETINLWDEKLAEYGEYIIKMRKQFVEYLIPKTQEIHSFLTSEKEKIEVSLETENVGENIKEDLKLLLAQKLERDIILGYTTVGPHRDDLKIKVNGEDIRIYGSQGQQRTCALTLKLAELELYKDKYGEYPVLILDDALSELDVDRRSKLLEKIKNVQTIITCTELPSEMEGDDIKMFVIENGKIKED